MKTKTKGQIAKKVKELWWDSFFYDREQTRPKVSVPELTIKIADDCIDITLSCMYSAPGLSFKQLFALSEFFGTDNINDDERFNHKGCEACDYGSEYGFTLTVRPKEKND